MTGRQTGINMTSHKWRLAAAALGLVLLTACGDSDSDNGNPPTAPSGGGPGPSGATITIGNNGVTPSSVTISVGQSVTFVNNSGSIHEMDSDPHPQHTDCPQINAVGTIGNGQTKLTNALTTARTCGFHDHTQPDTNNLKGTITIR
jgi:plastocyanin